MSDRDLGPRCWIELKERALGSGFSWGFKARFRRDAFGWQSPPAVRRVNEAVSEILKVARTDAV